SEFIARSFGTEFQKVFTIIKQQELDTFDCQVTPLEYDACL
ncbi:MAG: glutamine synthetase, partial [Alcanivorax sp.]